MITKYYMDRDGDIWIKENKCVYFIDMMNSEKVRKKVDVSFEWMSNIHNFKKISTEQFFIEML